MDAGRSANLTATTTDTGTGLVKAVALSIAGSSRAVPTATTIAADVGTGDVSVYPPMIVLMSGAQVSVPQI